MAIFDWLSRRIFNAVHRNNLVYNTCWEDPRLDREALQIGPSDAILVITSAGCNALDYALCGPGHVYAVDMNPRQNALLDLKMAGIRGLEFEEFFRMFGEGHLPGARRIYHDKLRRSLPDWSRNWWDTKIKWFENRRNSFYFRGTSGLFARMAKVYTDKVIKVRPHLEAILDAASVEEQRRIYDEHLRDSFGRFLKFALNRDTTMSMLGVPLAQRRQIEATYDAHAACGTYLGGVHLELTGDDVTECIGGASGLSEHDLSTNYASACDPRLNYQQSLEMAFLLAKRMAVGRH
jgi:S-adenosylmethionine-diacylglycerol 3-amino-3-carboxypropyl transferase